MTGGKVCGVLEILLSLIQLVVTNSLQPLVQGLLCFWCEQRSGTKANSGGARIPLQDNFLFIRNGDGQRDLFLRRLISGCFYSDRVIAKAAKDEIRPPFRGGRLAAYDSRVINPNSRGSFDKRAGAVLQGQRNCRVTAVKPVFLGDPVLAVSSRSKCQDAADNQGNQPRNVSSKRIRSSDQKPC